MPINYKDYPANWKEMSQHIRFVRAKGKCEWCGAEHAMPHPVTGSRVVLTVAHVDHNNKNNSMENLAALCQKCHLTHDAKQHAENAKKTRQRKQGLIDMFNEETP